MKARDGLEFAWTLGYLFLLAVFPAYPWICYYFGVLSPFPVGVWTTVVVTPLCGAAVYLFIGSLRKSLLAIFAMCILVYVIIGVFSYALTYESAPEAQWISLRVALLTYFWMIYIFPLSLGGCWITSLISK